MCELNGKFPYDCIVYSVDDLCESKEHDAIYEFESSAIDNEDKLQGIRDDISKIYSGKYVWALYGSNNENEWICLQVASRRVEDVVSEILGDIECMVKRDSINGRVWSSKFHSNVFQPNYEYVLSDIKHQKYILMKENFEKFILVAPKQQIIAGYGVIEHDKINQYIEVKYACNKKPLFWNAYAKEHYLVKEFCGEDD